MAVEVVRVRPVSREDRTGLLRLWTDYTPVAPTRP
jgi:hypothetical protein